MIPNRIVMTLLVRNEADIIRDVFLYHLKVGVDHFVVTDNGSTDGTVEIIEEFVRVGVADLIHEGAQNYAQSEWVTRMALFARNQRGAGWIVNSDADEFWHHSAGSLKFAVYNRDESILRLYRRNMLPELDEDASRVSPLRLMTTAVVAPVGPGSPDDMDRYMLWQLAPKMICAALNLQAVAQGNHDAEFSGPKTVHDLSETIIYHYPVRSFSQFEEKVIQGGEALARNNLLPESSEISLA